MRDTDRKIISEALRVNGRDWGRHWGQDWSYPHPRQQLTLISNVTGDDLEITYSETGRIYRLVHWQPVESTGNASRTPITQGKREYVLNVLGAKP